MLRELQRVKSEGDFENLVENYGTQVDAEVLERYAALGEAACKRFVNPRADARHAGRQDR